jgi:hypothetical protein
MSAFYDEMAETAGELIGEFGQSVTLTALTSGIYNPADGSAAAAPADHTVLGVEMAYTAREIDGVRIQGGDKRLLIDGTAQPTVGWQATYGGETYQIVTTEPVNPGGTLLCTILQLRRA